VYSSVSIGVVLSVLNAILTHIHFNSLKTHATGTKGNQTAKISLLAKHNINISHATQQRHPLPDRKRTTRTAVVVTKAVPLFQAAVVTAAMRSGPDGGPRARAAEQQQSGDMRRPWHGGGLGHTDRDPVPGSWTACAPVRGQLNCTRKRSIRLFQIWACSCSKLVDFMSHFL
jgi:hypothetical protein